MNSSYTWHWSFNGGWRLWVRSSCIDTGRLQKLIAIAGVVLLPSPSEDAPVMHQSLHIKARCNPWTRLAWGSVVCDKHGERRLSTILRLIVVGMNLRCTTDSSKRMLGVTHSTRLLRTLDFHCHFQTLAPDLATMVIPMSFSLWDRRWRVSTKLFHSVVHHR